ncbi:hypothetical protein Bca52824_017973 [Brassica carinata]|uniref:Uncharacterized protein n=1 Tax=Brassica carinata TaxID=52824 RepID=A0A8X7VNV4_BRACI|nr:hypothetical protein Bca52824_017973 [Brassica carinata]
MLLGSREVDGTACEVENKVDRTEDVALEEARMAAMRIMISIYGMILLGEIANGAMIRMRMEGRWWCSSERNIWRLCVKESNNSGVKSSDQVPRLRIIQIEEDPSVENSSQILVRDSSKPFNMHTGKLAAVMISLGRYMKLRMESEDDYFVEPNDGLHIRHDCLAAFQEELDCLRSQYAEEVSLRHELQFELAQMREEIKELKQLIML